MVCVLSSKTKNEGSFVGWSPRKVQSFLDTLEYDRNAHSSVKSVLKTGKANCLGGALTAAYLLEENYGSELLLFRTKKHIGHAIYVFSENGNFGGIGKSRNKHLEWRDPIYTSEEEVYKSYSKYLENPDWWVTIDLKNLPFKVNWINGNGNINEIFWDIAIIELLKKI